MYNKQQYSELLNHIISDMEVADEIYKPSNFWQHGSERINNDLESFGIENFRNFISALGFFVPTYRFMGTALDPDRYAFIREKFVSAVDNDYKSALTIDDVLTGTAQAYSDYRVYKASYIDSPPYTSEFSESDIGNPVERFEFEDNFYSRSSLNYLLGINFMKSCIKDLNIKTVLEIGGGFGTLGEILLSDDKNDVFYANIDIPPTNIFSTYYLKQIFGNANILDYDEFKKQSSHNLQDLHKNYKGAVLAPWQIEQLKGEVDLLVNFISFQEMEPHIVKNYLSNFDQLNTKYILLRNLREGKNIATENSIIGVKTPILADDYDKFLPNYELIDTNVLPFGFRTVDGFNSELRLYQRK